MTDLEAQDIIQRTQDWTRAFQTYDKARLLELITEDFSVMIGVAGSPFQHTGRERWLEVIADYKTVSGTIDDIQVNVYGDTAVVWMLYTQQASIYGNDRSGQFVLNDIWVKTDGVWKMHRRLSSRPEPANAARPS